MTTVDGLMDHLLPLSMIKESCLNIMVGQTLDMEEIKTSSHRTWATSAWDRWMAWDSFLSAAEF